MREAVQRARGAAGSAWLKAAALAIAAALVGPLPARGQEPDVPPPGLRVESDGRLLTVTADDAPLDAILRAVGEATDLEVPVFGPTDTYSGAFDGVALPEALDRLLGERSYILHYDEFGEAKRLVVLAGNRGGAPAAIPAAHDSAADQTSPAQEESWIAQRLTSPDRGARIVAVRRLSRLPPDRAAALGLRVAYAERDAVVRGQLAATLGRVEGDAGVDVLTKLLGDNDPAVRIAAANALGGVAGAAAADALGRTLVHGTDAALRQAALDALTSHAHETGREHVRRVAARSGDPLADAARRALSGEPASVAPESIDEARP